MPVAAEDSSPSAANGDKDLSQGDKDLKQVEKAPADSESNKDNESPEKGAAMVMSIHCGV